MIHPDYKKPKIDTGDLRTLVSFFEYVSNPSPEPSEDMKKELYQCFALIYNPSMKDMEILTANGTKEGLTIKIRDPQKNYIPSNKHKVVVDDYRYGADKVWEIKDVSFDFEDNAFIKIVLGVSS